MTALIIMIVNLAHQRKIRISYISHGCYGNTRVCTNLKDNFYLSPLNFSKIVCTIFGVIIFQDFAAPSHQNNTLNLQTGRSG